MFSNTFLAALETYRDQPATVVLDCAGGCDADRIRTAAALNPGRILWADGDVDLDSGADIGSATSPVILVVDGAASVDITFNGLLAGVPGLIDGTPVDWALSGTGTVRGAVLASDNLTVGGPVNIVRDGDVLTRLRWRAGSFVKVPGGWSDF
jgi:hypothetical protein